MVAARAAAAATASPCKAQTRSCYISRIIAGRKVTSIDVLERIADGCGIPDESRMTLGLAPRRQTYRPDMAGRLRSRQSDVPANRSWREAVRAAAQLWEGDVNRRDMLRQTVFSFAAYTLPALRWFTAPAPQSIA